jgi:hypothetical protein
MQCRAAVSPPSSKMLVKQMQLCASAERNTKTLLECKEKFIYNKYKVYSDKQNK